jgi:hypothetical protein
LSRVVQRRSFGEINSIRALLKLEQGIEAICTEAYKMSIEDISRVRGLVTQPLAIRFVQEDLTFVDHSPVDSINNLNFAEDDKSI